MNKPKFNKELKNPMREHIKEKGPSIYIPDVVPFFKDIPIRQVDCGLKYVFALSEEGELYSWGDNGYKQLAQSDPMKKKLKLSLNNLKDLSNSDGPLLSSEPKVKEDTTFAQNGGRFLNKPRKIELFGKKGLRVKQISCSKGEKHSHAACLTEDGRVFMWGDPYKGQIGLFRDDKGTMHDDTSLYPVPLELNLGFLEHPPQPRSKDPYADAAADAEDSQPEAGELQQEYEPDRVRQVRCGGVHTALLTEQGRLYTFGSAADGQQAQQEFFEHSYLYKGSKPKYVDALHGKKVIDVQASAQHFVALIELPQD